VGKKLSKFREQFENLSQAGKFMFLKELERTIVEEQKKIDSFIDSVVYALSKEFHCGNYVLKDTVSFMQENMDFIEDIISDKTDTYNVVEPEKYTGLILDKLSKRLKGFN